MEIVHVVVTIISTFFFQMIVVGLIEWDSERSEATSLRAMYKIKINSEHYKKTQAMKRYKEKRHG